MYFACAAGAQGRELSMYLHTVLMPVARARVVYFDTPDAEVPGGVLCPSCFCRLGAGPAGWLVVYFAPRKIALRDTLYVWLSTPP